MMNNNIGMNPMGVMNPMEMMNPMGMMNPMRIGIPMGINNQPILMNGMNLDETAKNIKNIVEPYENKIRELEEIIKQKDFEITVLKQKLNTSNNNNNMNNINQINESNDDEYESIDDEYGSNDAEYGANEYDDGEYE